MSIQLHSSPVLSVTNYMLSDISHDSDVIPTLQSS